jgi:transmembrane protein EpsG
MKISISRFNSQLLVSFVFFILFIISGFRFESGTDYDSYDLIYRVIGRGDEYWGNLELGSFALIKILNWISKDSIIFFSVTSFTILSIFFRAWSKYSRSIIFSVSLFVGFYFYFYSFNIVRQFIAIAIFFSFSTRHLISGNFARYLGVIIFASLFHVSVLAMIPFYFIISKKLSYYSIFSIFFVFCICFLSYPVLLRALPYIFPGYAIYGDYQSGSANFYLLCLSLIFLPLLIYKQKTLDRSYVGVVSFNAVYISILLVFLSYYNILFFRISLYLGIYVTILIPEFWFFLKNYSGKLIASILLIICVFSNMVYHLYFNVGGVFPYAIVFFR